MDVAAFNKLKNDCIPVEGGDVAKIIDGIIVTKEPTTGSALQTVTASFDKDMSGFPNSLLDVLNMSHNMSLLLRDTDGSEKTFTARELCYVAGQIDIAAAYLAFMADKMNLPAADGM